MSTHLNEELLGRLQRHEATPEELLPVLRHLSGCPECSTRTTQIVASAPAQLRSILSERADDVHLDPDSQLLPYVDRQLDDADVEIVESHLSACFLCKSEVTDLRKLQGQDRAQRLLMMLAAAIAGAGVLLTVLLYVFDPVDPIPQASQRPLPPIEAPASGVLRATPSYPHSEWDALVSEARKTGKLPYPSDLAELSPSPDVLRGNLSAGSVALFPAGIVIDETRPQFSWTPQEGASYVVVIFEGDNEIMTSAPLEVTQWTPEREFQRGRTYTWQVEATRGETTRILPAPPAPPAMFRIISDAHHRQIREALAKFPDDSLLHAVLYAQTGLRREAESAYTRALHR